jgi:hypothetical protein
MGFSDTDCMVQYAMLPQNRTLSCAVGKFTELNFLGIIPDTFAPNYNGSAYCGPAATAHEYPYTNLTNITMCSEQGFKTKSNLTTPNVKVNLLEAEFNNSCLNQQNCSLDISAFMDWNSLNKTEDLWDTCFGHYTLNDTLNDTSPAPSMLRADNDTKAPNLAQSSMRVYMQTTCLQDPATV